MLFINISNRTGKKIGDNINGHSNILTDTCNKQNSRPAKSR